MTQNYNLERTWLVAVIFLGIVLLGSELTYIDLEIQDQLFSFDRRRWWVDGNDPLLKLIFYHAPKVAIIAIGLVALMGAILPDNWRSRLRLAGKPRRAWAVVFLTLGSVPALIGWGKAKTNVFCPSEIRRYGGEAPFVRIFDHYPENDQPAKRGRCFPAGHASGGFALVSLAALASTRQGQRRAIAVGLGAGAIMGGYQMAKGAHYLSHTLVTAAIAWLIFLAWQWAVGSVPMGPHERGRGRALENAPPESSRTIRRGECG